MKYTLAAVLIIMLVIAHLNRCAQDRNLSIMSIHQIIPVRVLNQRRDNCFINGDQETNVNGLKIM